MAASSTETSTANPRQLIFLVDRSPVILTRDADAPRGIRVTDTTGGAGKVVIGDAAAAIREGHDVAFVSVAKTSLEHELAASGQPFVFEYNGHEVSVSFVSVPDNTYALARDGMFSSELWMLAQEQDHPDVRAPYSNEMWESYVQTNDMMAATIDKIANHGATLVANDLHTALVAESLHMLGRRDLDTIFVGHTAWPRSEFLAQHFRLSRDAVPEFTIRRLVNAMCKFKALAFSAPDWGHNFIGTAQEFGTQNIPPVNAIPVAIDPHYIRNRFKGKKAQDRVRALKEMLWTQGVGNVVVAGGRVEWYKNLHNIVKSERLRHRIDPLAKNDICVVVGDPTRVGVKAYRDYFRQLVGEVNEANEEFAPKQFEHIRERVADIERNFEMLEQDAAGGWEDMHTARFMTLAGLLQRVYEEADLPFRMASGDFDNVLAWFAVSDVLVTGANLDGYNTMVLEHALVSKPTSTHVLTRDTGVSQHLDRVEQRERNGHVGDYGSDPSSAYSIRMSVVVQSTNPATKRYERALQEAEQLSSALAVSDALRLNPDHARGMHDKMVRLADAYGSQQHWEQLEQALNLALGRSRVRGVDDPGLLRDLQHGGMVLN